MGLDLGAAYLEHAGALAGWFRRHAAPPETAEDLVAEVFLKAARSSYRDTGAPIGAWLMAIARTVRIDWLRHEQSRGRAGVTLLVLDDEHDVAAALEAESIDPDLLAALRALPRRQRTAVMLRHLRDLPVREVAREMGLSPSEVSKLTHRGLRRLQRRLGPPPGWESPGEGMGALIAEALREREARRERKEA